MRILLNGKTLLLLLLLLCLMISCNNKIEHSDKRLNNKQIRFILEERGIPDAECDFLIKTDSLQEYQYNLYNIFPRYKEEKIEIKELSWSKKRVKSIIWFYRVGEDWISIDNLTWDTTEINY